MLLPTILSRCQIINFPRLSFETILKILELNSVENKHAVTNSIIIRWKYPFGSRIVKSTLNLMKLFLN